MGHQPPDTRVAARRRAHCSYNITRMIVIAVMGAMYGSIYWQQGTAISGAHI